MSALSCKVLYWPLCASSFQYQTGISSYSRSALPSTGRKMQRRSSGRPRSISFATCKDNLAGIHHTGAILARWQLCAQAKHTNGSSTTNSKVAVLGIGLMGNKIARRLAEAGCTVAAWNRDPSKSSPLSDAGIEVHESAQQAVQASDVVLLMLSDAAAIQDVLLNPSKPVDLMHKVVIQMGTIGPKESQAIASRVQAASAEYLEAPVLGSQPEASRGTLLIMVGSETNPQDSKAWPVLTKLSQEPKHMGTIGTAAATKLALNQLIASLTVGFSTSLGLLQRNGANVDAFMDILRGSALYAPTFDKKLQRMLDREYSNPNFPTKHLLKDIKLFASEAEKVDLDNNLLKGLEAVIASTVERGLADTDYSAVHEGILEPSVTA